MNLTYRDFGFTQLRPQPEHERALTEMEAWCLDAIRTWCQRGEPIPARVLGSFLGLEARTVRKLINHLISRQYHGLPIYPVPGAFGGYFTPDEAWGRDRAGQAVAAQLMRARTGAVKARDLGATVQELSQQMVELTLDLGEDVRAKVAGALRGPATHAQVRQALARYARDPQRFARQIADLRACFNGLFVSQEELTRALRQHSEALIAQTLAGLAGERIGV